MNRFSRLLDFVRPYAGVLAITFVAAVVASVLDGFTFALLIPFLKLLFGGAPDFVADTPTTVERVLNLVVGFAIGVDRAAAVRNVVILILAAVAVKNVAVYTAGTLGVYIQEGVARDMREGLFTHIQRLQLGFFQRMKGGQLVSRMIADIEQACGIVSASLVSVVQNVILILVYLAILFSLSWRLALLVLVLAPAIAAIMRPIQLRIRNRLSGALYDRGEVTTIVSETIEGARVVKAHGAEEYERHRFGEAADNYSRGVVRAQRLAVLAHPVSETLGAGVVLLLVVLGISGGSSGTGMRPELFIPFIAVALRLVSPVKALTQFPMRAEVSLAAAERVFEILEEAEDDVDPPDGRACPGLVEQIRFAIVWFGYEHERWVLKGVDLTVRRGEVMAIVGPSGAGKSTLVDLLPRFIDPSRGRVEMDGVPLSAYGRRSLRKLMGIVSQHTVIFNDTVQANIAYGDQADASPQAVRTAARAANADRFIEQLPQGYDTVLGERGMRLSGGERQRIAIARAILRDPPILILDEATSELDVEGERLIQEAIARLLENRTVLVIAHRLSTVSRADEIVVLEGGSVVERGRHHDLLTAGGVYQRLYALEMHS
ncbi:MAG: ABC transporter ATP-binding protein [Gemmatimonadales bacterium]